jgi:hypothetical protein
METRVPFMGTPAALRKAAGSLRFHAEQLESGGIRWVNHTPWHCSTGCALLVNLGGQSKYVVPLSGRRATMLAMQRAITAIQEDVAPNYRLPVRGLVDRPEIITLWNDTRTTVQPVIAMLRLAADILDGWVDQLAACDAAAGARPRITAKGM